MKPGIRAPLPSVSSPKKSPAKKKPLILRAKSFSAKLTTKSLEVSPILSTRTVGKSFSEETIAATKAHKSDIGVKLPGLYGELPHIAALKLPKTDPPAASKAYTIKKRFSDMGKTLERIPSEDFLGALLYQRPGFRQVLEENISRCKRKLAKLKMVQATICEEDGDISERLSLIEETV